MSWNAFFDSAVVSIAGGVIGSIVGGLVTYWVSSRLQKRLLASNERTASAMLRELTGFLHREAIDRQEHEKKLAMAARNFERSGLTGFEGLS